MTDIGVYTLALSNRRDRAPMLSCYSHLALYALSVMLARQHFKHLVLFADRTAIEFIKGLDLPFDEIVRLEQYPLTGREFIWASGKLFAYREMVKRGEPFAHIDFDALLFARLPQWLLGGECFVQNEETFGEGITSTYRLYYEPNHYAALPVKSEELKYAVAQKVHRPCNFGVFGGNNLEFIGRYVEDAIATMMEPRNLSALIRLGDSANVFLEQYLFFGHTALHRVRPRQLINFSKFNDAIQYGGYGYIHLWGEFKNYWNALRFVRRHLLSHFPEMYYRVRKKTKGWPCHTKTLYRPTGDDHIHIRKSLGPQGPVHRIWNGPNPWAIDHIRREALTRKTVL